MDRFMVPESVYIHGNELSQFVYIQVPMNLIISECFSKISGNAKILYGLLLNRTSLSVRNGWEDGKGRTYIYYTIEDVMADMHVSYATASRMFSELTNIVVTGTDNKGKKIWFGLVEKERILNKPSRIYVHKVEEVIRFIEGMSADPVPRESTEEIETSGHSGQRFEQQAFKNHANTGHIRNDMTVISDLISRSYQNCDDGDIKNDMTVVSDLRLRSYQICDENNNNNINNNINNIDSINHDMNYIYPINLSDEPDENSIRDMMDKMDENELIQQKIKLIRENVRYNVILKRDPRDLTLRKRLDELIEIMAEICVLNVDVKIGIRVIPASVIKSRFENYDRETMEYVLESLNSTTTKVKNIRQYLITTLYNAPSTVENHQNLDIQHDMNTWGLK